MECKALHEHLDKITDVPGHGDDIAATVCAATVQVS